jgi:hypothetical protein
MTGKRSDVVPLTALAALVAALISTACAKAPSPADANGKVTPISQQKNNALKGTQYIDGATYELTIDGLVDHPLSLSYADLQAYPQISQILDLNCGSSRLNGPARLSALYLPTPRSGRRPGSSSSIPPTSPGDMVPWT